MKLLIINRRAAEREGTIIAILNEKLFLIFIKFILTSAYGNQEEIMSWHTFSRLLLLLYLSSLLLALFAQNLHLFFFLSTFLTDNNNFICI